MNVSASTEVAEAPAGPRPASPGTEEGASDAPRVSEADLVAVPPLVGPVGVRRMLGMIVLIAFGVGTATAAVHGWRALLELIPGALTGLLWLYVWRTGRGEAAAAYAVLVLAGVSITGGALMDGGIESRANLWLVLLPIFGVVLLGQRAGLVALGVAILSAVAQFALEASGAQLTELSLDRTKPPVRLAEAVAFLCLVGGVVLRFDRARRRMEVRLRAQNARLAEAAERIRSLQGFLSICMYCKSVRTGDDEGSWERIESYIARYGDDVTFSHGLCGECLERHFPDSAGEADAP